jgi:hypothetical protein
MNLFVLLAMLVARAQPAAFSIVRDVPLPGDTSRFDYVSLDPGSHRLFIAHLGAGTLPVYDIASGAVIGEVQNWRAERAEAIFLSVKPHVGPLLGSELRGSA